MTGHRAGREGDRLHGAGKDIRHQPQCLIVCLPRGSIKRIHQCREFTGKAICFGYRIGRKNLQRLIKHVGDQRLSLI